MGDTYKESRNFRNCESFQDIFSKTSNTGESSLDTEHGSGTSSSNSSEHVKIENMLKKGFIQQIKHQTGEFLSNIFLSGKGDGETVLS